MPNHEGNGPPAKDLGQMGDRYLDKATGELYSKRKTGWSNLTVVEVECTIRQKRAWLAAAKQDDETQRLEHWAAKVLHKAAAEQFSRDESEHLPTHSDAS